MSTSLATIRAAPSGPESALANALDLLFEHSPVLIETLEPKLSDVLKALPSLDSYNQLIDLALGEISKWSDLAQAEFISGHPRIGENKNLSAHSAREQGAGGITPTPPEVLARLEHLNALYEAKYPGLRYITFVNGRTRAVIVEEMEERLSLDKSLSPTEPPADAVVPYDAVSSEWKGELNRAVYDIGRIAKSRAASL